MLRLVRFKTTEKKSSLIQMGQNSRHFARRPKFILYAAQQHEREFVVVFSWQSVTSLQSFSSTMARPIRTALSMLLEGTVIPTDHSSATLHQCLRIRLRVPY
jgi:hypothetical protein